MSLVRLLLTGIFKHVILLQHCLMNLCEFRYIELMALWIRTPTSTDLAYPNFGSLMSTYVACFVYVTSAVDVIKMRIFY